MIWWSERSGWGHFYLYDRDGKLKNAITSGAFRASRIVDVDAKNRLLYFTGNGREPGENIYYQHLYRVHLDGTGLTLLDPGRRPTTRSILSPSQTVPRRQRLARRSWPRRPSCATPQGNEVMDLEKADCRA